MAYKSRQRITLDPSGAEFILLEFMNRMESEIEIEHSRVTSNQPLSGSQFAMQLGHGNKSNTITFSRIVTHSDIFEAAAYQMVHPNSLPTVSVSVQFDFYDVSGIIQSTLTSSNSVLESAIVKYGSKSNETITTYTITTGDIV